MGDPPPSSSPASSAGAASGGSGSGAHASGGAGGTAGDAGFMYLGKRIEIRDVWADNLEQEFAAIRKLVGGKYKYVAMDTEFPGVVARPIGAFSTHTDYHYQTLRVNVDLLKIIQLGLSFADEDGNLAPDCPTWQFNFKFSLDEDMFAQDSIELLRHSGIEFDHHKAFGIEVDVFGELLMTSGLVLMDDVKWNSFHSGYDFGYLLKLLTASPLPADEPAFFELLRTYFPCIFDVKYMMTSTDSLKGGLNKLAEELGVERVGRMHTAGSDSLLTSACYFKLRKDFFGDRKDDDRHLGILYGLGAGSQLY